MHEIDNIVERTECIPCTIIPYNINITFWKSMNNRVKLSVRCDCCIGYHNIVSGDTESFSSDVFVVDV